MNYNDFWSWDADERGIACQVASLYGYSGKVRNDNSWTFSVHGEVIYQGKSDSTALALRNVEMLFSRMIFKDRRTLAALKRMAKITKEIEP